MRRKQNAFTVTSIMRELKKRNHRFFLHEYKFKKINYSLRNFLSWNDFQKYSTRWILLQIYICKSRRIRIDFYISYLSPLWITFNEKKPPCFHPFSPLVLSSHATNRGTALLLLLLALQFFTKVYNNFNRSERYAVASNSCPEIKR